KGVSFRNADLRGADLSQALEPEPHLFRGSIYDSRTEWGEDLRPNVTDAERGPDVDYAADEPQTADSKLRGRSTLPTADAAPDLDYAAYARQAAASKLVGRWSLPTADGAATLSIQPDLSYRWEDGDQALEGVWKLLPNQPGLIELPTRRDGETWFALLKDDGG